MKLSFEVATVPNAVAAVSSILVCAIAQVVVGVTYSTTILQGYSIVVIALIAYMGIGLIEEVGLGSERERDNGCSRLMLPHQRLPRESGPGPSWSDGGCASPPSYPRDNLTSVVSPRVHTTTQ